VYKSTSVVLGWFFNTNILRGTDKLSFQVELLYQANQYHTNFNEKNPLGYSFDMNYDITIKQQLLKIPALIRYTYPKGTVKPFVQGGISNAFSLRSSNHLKKTTVLPSGSIEWEGNAVTIQSTQQSILAGIGLQSRVLSRAAYLEARVEKGNGVSRRRNGSGGPYSRSTSLQILLGMAF
jgi:hypothetical protein